MTDLITRLENAPAGDRELDADAFKILNPEEYSRLISQRLSEQNSIMLKLYSLSRAKDIAHREIAWPPITTSIDAITALIEEKLFNYFIESSGPRFSLHIPTPSPNRWRCEITMGKPGRFGGFATGWGATEALARCIALLKALEARDD